MARNFAVAGAQVKAEKLTTHIEKRHWNPRGARGEATMRLCVAVWGHFEVAPIAGVAKVKKSIDRRWLPLNALRAFEGVAKHGSFTAAANALLISQSALSRHVIALERLTGVQLFDRKPHALALTKAGQHLLPAVVKSFDRLEYALDDIRNDGAPIQRTLRVQMPPTFAVQLAVPILRDFRSASTEVDIDLISPHGVGPPLGDVDVAVVYSKPSVTDLVTDLLWQEKVSILCHPNVATAHAGKSLGAFIEANEIVHVRISDTPRHHVWAQFARQEGLTGLNYERGLVFDTAVLAVQYALSGQGLALVDTALFAEEIRSGRLVKPFDVTLDHGYGYYLITHPEGLGDTAIALFRSWLIERFGTRVASSAEPQMHLAVSNE
jgi:DNA-binding transcriptional LysR family regulator